MRGPKDIAREIAEKIESDSGKRALERERKEEEEKKLFEKLDKRYVKREEVKLWIALSNLPKKFFAFIAKKVCDVCKKLLGGG